MAGRAGEIDGNLVLLDGGSHFDVEHRIRAKRINEIDIAARQAVLIAAHAHLAAEQMNIPEENGVVEGATNAHIGIVLKSSAGPFQYRSRRRIRLHVKLQVAQERRSCTRPAGRLGGRSDQRSNIEAF